MIGKQKTIQQRVSVSGLGLHTGKLANLTLKPADIYTGILFKRTDIENYQPVKLGVDDVFDTSRGTFLRKNGAEFKTIEHLLAAVTGLEIDNILIEIDSDEIPILDGSSKIFADLISSAGIISQNAEKQYLRISEEIKYKNRERGIEIIAYPSEEFKISVEVDYDSKVIVPQKAEFHRIEDFMTEIAPCRTFVFLHELQYLIAHNLVRGGDVSNAIVFVEYMPDETTLKQLAEFFNKPDIKVSEQSVLNNTVLRFENEPARHKLLDLIGDLTLLGQPLKAQIIAKKPGHFSNIEFAKLIQKHILNGSQS